MDVNGEAWMHLACGIIRACRVWSIMAELLVKRGREVRCYSTLFFFSSRRRHTRFDCDWSSDVCSSDLRDRFKFAFGKQTILTSVNDRQFKFTQIVIHTLRLMQFKVFIQPFGYACIAIHKSTAFTALWYLTAGDIRVTNQTPWLDLLHNRSTCGASHQKQEASMRKCNRCLGY